jgi:hypothetical protein
MLRIPTRLWALAVLVVLLAAQVHVWVEASPAQASGHTCQVCIAGVWAVVSPSPGLAMSVRAMPLDADPPQASEKNQRTEASAPRAPPLA